jgi:hypothetical protein
MIIDYVLVLILKITFRETEKSSKNGQSWKTGNIEQDTKGSQTRHESTWKGKDLLPFEKWKVR